MRPIRYDDMPPSVLPRVATASAGQYCCGLNLSTPNSTASEPPGSSVAARKLLAKSAPRLNDSSMSVIVACRSVSGTRVIVSNIKMSLSGAGRCSICHHVTGPHPMRHACCLAMFALVVLVSYRPVAAQMLGLYAGRTEIRDATHDKSHAWGLEYVEQVAPHFGLSLLYLNEGHPSDQRRDGFGMQAWARTSPLGGRLTLAAGVGPYYYFDTTRRGQAGYADDHGLGLISSLAAG